MGTFCLSSDAQIQYRLDRSVYEQNKNGQWSPYLVLSYVHNGGDQILSKKQVKINANGDRVNFEQKLYTFNAQSGMLETKEDQSWSAQTSSWVSTNKYEYLNVNSKRITMKTFKWQTSDSTWNISDIDSFFYDTNGDQIDHSTYTWDNTEFIKYYAVQTTYKSAGVRDSVISWSRSSPSRPFSYHIYFQNAAGKDTAVHEYRVDRITGKKSFTSILRLLRDSNGIVVKEEHLVDYISPGSLEVLLIYDNEVNERVDHSSVLYDTELEEEVYAEKAVVRRILSLEKGGSWGQSTRGTYYYDTKLPNSLIQLETSEIFIYPNPCTDLIQLELLKFPEAANIRIFDMRGKQVLNQNLSESNTVEVASLNAGVFILQVLESNGNVVGISKFIKK